MSDSTGGLRRAGGSIMASVIVLFVGLTGVCFVAFLAAPENVYLTLGIIAGSFLVLSILVLGVIPRVPLPTGALSWFRGRKGRNQYVGYSPKISKPTYDTFGTNAPPTVDEVRDIKAEGKNWVPSRTAASRSRPSQRS